MNVKRFFASNSRAALAMVRKALGPDAVILSNKTVNGGSEILALAGTEMDELVAQESLSFIGGQSHAPLPAAAVADEPRQAPLRAAEALSPATLAALAGQHQQRSDTQVVFTRPVDGVAPKSDELASSAQTARKKPDHLAANRSSSAAGSASGNTQELEYLRSEMRTMRGVIESQLSELVWDSAQRRNPSASVLLRRMLSAGFGAALARQIVENMPPQQTTSPERMHDWALTWAKSVLEKNLRTIDSEDEILEQGGVFALIGPTGVGKTTTTAKLAARFVMKHGASKLGLITTDAYRIGGHEQLRIYGKILGVMVHAVKDEIDLKLALSELRDKHTILIDTVGVNQRDAMVTKQIAMLGGAGDRIRRLLCINATSTGETLMDVVQAYRGRGLAGCILTKMDEAATIGSALDVILREKLCLYYMANGQRVPEDLHVANKQLLLHHAFKLRKSAAGRSFQFRDEDLPLLMAHAAKLPSRELHLG